MADVLRGLEAATQRFAAAVEHEMKLEDERGVAKMAAVSRIMSAGDNPMTGKPHSFSSAEAAVNSDRDYAEYLALLRDAAKARILARGNYEAAIIAGHIEANKR
jgi:hypothetical protein